jgi:hypothetical protein
VSPINLSDLAAKADAATKADPIADAKAWDDFHSAFRPRHALHITTALREMCELALEGFVIDAYNARVILNRHGIALEDPQP